MESLEQGAIRLLEKAVEEIKQLRKSNQMLSIKVETFDKAVMLVEAGSRLPQRGYSHESDLCKEIEDTLHRVKSDRQNKPTGGM